MTLYAGAMAHPIFTPGFSPQTVSPHVCFLCNTEACAVNDEHPTERVLHFAGGGNELWEFPAIEIGVRCWREKAGQSGAPTVAEQETLRTALQQAEEARVAAILRANEAEDLAEAAVSPIVDTLVSTVKTELAKGVNVAALAAANTVRKDAKANGAAA